MDFALNAPALPSSLVKAESVVLKDVILKCSQKLFTFNIYFPWIGVLLFVWTYLNDAAYQISNGLLDQTAMDGKIFFQVVNDYSLLSSLKEFKKMKSQLLKNFDYNWRLIQTSVVAHGNLVCG